MKIGLQTWGSDGDIRPFIALAGLLSKKGHSVTLIVFSVDGKNYSELSQILGFELIQITKEIDLHFIFEKLTRTNDILKQIKILLDQSFFPYQNEMFVAAMQLCQENDLVIGHHIVTPLKAASDKTACPYVSVFLCHSMLYSKFLAPDPFPDFGPALNVIAWKIVNMAVNFMLREEINRLRKQYGVLPVKSVLKSWHSKHLNLVAVSSVFCQMPSDWSDNIHVCGFFDVPLAAEQWLQPAELKAFIESGDPPVYFTFGSMTQIALEESTQLMLEAARLSGKRAIIQSNWDHLSANIKSAYETENLFFVSKLPHHHIFPLCALVVHHGGAGTTHSVTRSGAASVIVKHAFDQGYWGKELQRIGIGGKVLNRRNVTPLSLAKQVIAVYDSQKIRQKAQTAGKSMQAENGVENAVLLIEKFFCSSFSE
jgi:sterol 3beta-glucosyltransferase